MFTKLFSKPVLRLSMVILVNENILRVTPIVSKEIKQRSFARWSSRKPSKVLVPDESPPGSFDTEEFYKSEYTDKDSFKKEQHKIVNVGEKYDGQDEKNTYSSGDQDYVVLGEHDFTFSELMAQVGNRKMRRKHDVIMLEGKRVNLDALQAGLKPKKIFFTDKSFLDELNLPSSSKIPLFKLPYKTIKLWSKLDTPPGIIGFYGIPKEEDIVTDDTIPVKVLCDNVRDPSNMGSIIRVAASVGCMEVILMKGCTDPWDAKVLRCASGGHFHIPITMDLTWKEHKKFLRASDVVFLADSRADRKPPFNYNLAQSLYHDVNYTTSGVVVVVIGGETEGLSSEAFRLATHHNGSRVYIPLSNCMESLNSGCALSVVLFEIKRQFMFSENSFKINKTGSWCENAEESRSS